jgi:hypothetical protein
MNRDRIGDTFVMTDTPSDYMFLDELMRICLRSRIQFDNERQLHKYFKTTFNLKDTKMKHPKSKSYRIVLLNIKPTDQNLYILHKRPMKMEDVMKYIDMYILNDKWTTMADLRQIIETTHFVTLPPSQNIIKWIRENRTFDTSCERGLRRPA